MLDDVRKPFLSYAVNSDRDFMRNVGHLINVGLEGDLRRIFELIDKRMQSGRKPKRFDLIWMQCVSDLAGLLECGRRCVRDFLQLVKHGGVVLSFAYSKQCSIADNNKALTERVVQLHRKTAPL